MRKVLDAFLWRKCNAATLDSLMGVSRGQYHITLQAHDYVPFFRNLGQTNPTPRGGFEIIVPLQPFTGANPVKGTNITVRFMGSSSARRDWNIRSQRPETAYELWREGRGFANPATVGDQDYIIIARDTDNGFHARWLRTPDFRNIPIEMREHMNGSDAGWHSL